MKLYWVSLLIQDTENSKPWLCAMTDSETSLKSAMETIKRGRENYRVLSAWIDTFDENNQKETVYHHCYTNAIGELESN